MVDTEDLRESPLKKIINLTYGHSPELEVNQADLERVNRAWLAAIPAENFGYLDAITVDRKWRKTFTNQLEASYLTPDTQPSADEFVAAQAVIPYTIHSRPEEIQDQQGKAVQQLHTETEIQKVETQLTAFLELLQELDLPEIVKAAYLEKASYWQRFCISARKVGSIEFTQRQTSRERWNLLIEPASVTQDEIKLVYEDEARTILESLPSSTPPVGEVETQTPESASLRESVQIALKFLNLSASDFTDPQQFLDIQQVMELNADQFKSLFEITLGRAQLLKNEDNPDGWTVEIVQRGVTMDVNAAAKKITIPETETQPVDVGLWSLPHELLHIMRGENGSRQPVSLLQNGTWDYEITEEGIAMLAELVAGEPFGHDRQVELAARYYAIALSLKTTVNAAGERVATHSLQDIYNQLREFGVKPEYAQVILWRINRGTSLSRAVTNVTVGEGENLSQISVAETFIKDTIYFEGQMKVYSFIISLLTKDSAENTAALANTKDLRPHVLAHLGRAVMNSLVGETYKVEAVPSLRAGYQALVDLGKEAIISLIDYLGAGKMRLDELTNPDWNTILNRETLVHFRDFFTPSVASIQPRAT